MSHVDIDAVRARRQKLADVLEDEEYSGIRRIVEELYPDRAHFIYELLQNAEDTGATEAIFELESNCLSFEHNGRPFDQADVEAITNIGSGTKGEQEDKIGRFGVGFKAVFAYSETPHIWSPGTSFKITNLVLPWPIDSNPHIGQNTRFEFPFDNVKKPASEAYVEVEAGLAELTEMTLLFLKHMRKIEWRIGQRQCGVIRRIEHSDHHIEIRKESLDETEISSHFLRFSEAVEGLPNQHVSVAFALQPIDDQQAFDPSKQLADQFKIIPAEPGRVAVFFPAEKETSGLRFHLHAPFVPELSRASIKEADANQPLFAQITGLAARALHQIRDLGLLTTEFLGVLPNPDDELPDRYDPMRVAIISEMNTYPLTPTHSNSHAPASQLVQGKVSLKDFLTPRDLACLFDETHDPQWVKSAAQRNSDADRFLSGLDLTNWSIDHFIMLLQRKTRTKWEYITGIGAVDRPDKHFMAWLATHTPEWHQKMYALLYEELSPKGKYERLRDLQIVRLRDGNYWSPPNGL